jgi:phosphatidate cytidylyltransferase
MTLSSNLLKRILSALILAPVVLAIVSDGGWAYTAMIVVATGLGLREWMRLVESEEDRMLAHFALAAFFLTLIFTAWGSLESGLTIGVVFTLVLFLLSWLRGAKAPLWVAFGLPYMAGSGIALLYLRTLPITGFMLTCYLLAVVWGVDTGAYAVGRLIGGPKMAPKISPNKTWAGLLGGMALAAAFGYGVAYGMNAHRPDIALNLALLLALAAQGGDLFESIFKRRAVVKESGHLIPGHGGMLDRIDGLVAAGVVLALFEASVGKAIVWW